MTALSRELHEQALCRTEKHNETGYPFITPEGMRKDDFNRALEEAQAICNRCPIYKECRVAGLKEPRGTWAGSSYRDRGYDG